MFGRGICEKCQSRDEKFHAIGTIPSSNNRIVERNKIDTTNTQIHNRSLSWLGTGTAIKSGGVKLISNKLRKRRF
jgi:hypothetical protein